MSLFEELKRRNVFRVGIAYLVVSWLLLQVIDVVGPILRLPETVARYVLFFLAIGFLPALIFAWVFELTPQGVKRESEVLRSGSITARTGHKLDRAIIVALALAVAFLLFDRLGPGSGGESVPGQSLTGRGSAAGCIQAACGRNGRYRQVSGRAAFREDEQRPG